jgi:hypothetical protein
MMSVDQPAKCPKQYEVHYKMYSEFPALGVGVVCNPNVQELARTCRRQGLACINC